MLVIFKTHLDVGYTDLGQAVVDKYLNEYIPRAISVARELEGTDTPFAWTLGSWMVDQALKHDSDGSVERAIRDGLLRWHGLPFTTHTELMSKELFEYEKKLGLIEKFNCIKQKVGAIHQSASALKQITQVPELERIVQLSDEILEEL